MSWLDKCPTVSGSRFWSVQILVSSQVNVANLKVKLLTSQVLTLVFIQNHDLVDTRNVTIMHVNLRNNDV